MFGVAVVLGMFYDPFFLLHHDKVFMERWLCFQFGFWVGWDLGVL